MDDQPTTAADAEAYYLMTGNLPSGFRFTPHKRPRFEPIPRHELLAREQQREMERERAANRRPRSIEEARAEEIATGHHDRVAAAHRHAPPPE